MDTSISITAAAFFAFLKCSTKGYLLAIDEPASDAFFADIQARISSMYKSEVVRSVPVGTQVAEALDFRELWSSHAQEAIAHPVDCETVIYNFGLTSHEPPTCHSRESAPCGTFVSVSFLPWDKPDVSDNLLVCFGALALWQVTGILADTGT